LVSARATRLGNTGPDCACACGRHRGAPARLLRELPRLKPVAPRPAHPLTKTDPSGKFGCGNIFGNKTCAYLHQYVGAPLSDLGDLAIGTAEAPVVESYHCLLTGDIRLSNRHCLKLALAILAIASPGAAEEEALIAAEEGAVAVRGGESAAAAYGREVHATYDYGPGFVKEFRGLPSRARPDAVNLKTREVVELRPDRPAAIRRGKAQLRRYAAELNEEYPGPPFKTILVTYPPYQP
jgi:hypothetical protein